jgi:hypothetical protein
MNHSVRVSSSATDRLRVGGGTLGVVIPICDMK